MRDIYWKRSMCRFCTWSERGWGQWCDIKWTKKLTHYGYLFPQSIKARNLVTNEKFAHLCLLQKWFKGKERIQLPYQEQISAENLPSSRTGLTGQPLMADRPSHSFPGLAPHQTIPYVAEQKKCPTWPMKVLHCLSIKHSLLSKVQTFQLVHCGKFSRNHACL